MNYYLRNVDDDLWHKLKTKCLSRKISLRDLLISLVKTWLKEG